MFMPTFLALVLCFILLIVNTALAKKITFDREKLSPFECGFDPKEPARLPFSLRFYLIAVIFLIFDVEITLILPIPILSQFIKITTILLLALFFIFILVVGLFHE